MGRRGETPLPSWQQNTAQRGRNIPGTSAAARNHIHRRPPSPSESSSSTSMDEMGRTLLVRNGDRGGPRPAWGPEPGYRGPGGTLRSTRSVPALALATWDGEPCPVHGHGPHFYPPHHGAQTPVSVAQPMRRFGSVFDVRTLQYPPPPPMTPVPTALEKKSIHGSMSALGPPPMGPPHMGPPHMGPPHMGPPHMGPPHMGPYHMPPPMLMPPMMRPRPFVFPHSEPLPTRDPYRSQMKLHGRTSEDDYSVDQVCCRGHLVVLWIILAVVTIGVILGIILGVTIT
ncbi:proline-rich protein 2-like [Ornithodoros turicata]